MARPIIKEGQLISWIEERWATQYFPKYVKRRGVVIEVCCWDAWEYRTIIVLAFNGEQVILFDDDATIEVLNGKV